MTIYVLTFLIAGQAVPAGDSPLVFAAKTLCEQYGHMTVDRAVSERIPHSDTLTFDCIEAPLIGVGMPQ